MYHRCSHAIGRMKKNGKFFIVVAGGEFKAGSITNTIEILDPFTNQGWIMGNILARYVSHQKSNSTTNRPISTIHENTFIFNIGCKPNMHKQLKV